MQRPAFNVLFLCTPNSARSLMAEAILTKLAAGSDSSPTGALPEVMTLLKTPGQHLSGLRSKSWSEFTGPAAPKMDFVLTLCDTLHGQVCPYFGATVVT